MSQKTEFEDKELNTLAAILQAAERDSLNIDSIEKVHEVEDRLQRCAESIVADDDTLPITDVQACILNEAISVLVPLVRRNYLLLKQRRQVNEDPDRLLMTTDFPIRFHEHKNCRAVQLFMELPNVNKVIREDDEPYITIDRVGFYGDVSLSTYQYTSDYEELISHYEEPCISLKPHDNNLYRLSTRKVPIRTIPFFKKEEIFDRVDKLSRQDLEQLNVGQYKRTLKWLICACAKSLMTVKDTRETMFVQDNPTQRIHSSYVGFNFCETEDVTK
ncbi:hypothetical protein [Limosilactobacillus fermentum]|uniref:hypothetical protein n=1 Tax=Limosilactobacillus fermentum TaxID=1613 RepID=UPI001E64BA1E|nr:hypothetical protein [Limosilactobacillus fermentum]MCD5422950.1 hypothetical protein [Limosilactobacillus fermentum]